MVDPFPPKKGPLLQEPPSTQHIVGTYYWAHCVLVLGALRTLSSLEGLLPPPWAIKPTISHKE